MCTVKLVGVVWVQFTSMQILPTDVLPILITIMQVLNRGMPPFLSACSKGFLVTFAVKRGFNSSLSVSRVQDGVNEQVKFWLRTDCRVKDIHEGGWSVGWSASWNLFSHM